MATTLLRRVLADKCKNNANHPEEVARVWELLACTYQLQKQYSLADSAYEQSLSIKEKLAGKDSATLVVPLIELADTYFMEHKYAQAEALCRRALSIAQKAPSKGSADVAALLESLAAVYKNQDRGAPATLVRLLFRLAAVYKNQSQGGVKGLLNWQAAMVSQNSAAR